MKQEQPDMKKRILENSIFGSSLKQLTKKDDGLVVPYVLFRLCNFIGMNGMTEKGLFNSSTNPDHLEYLKTCFNQAGDVPLESESSTLSAADLLKLFLLELADPVIPSSMQAAFSTAVNGFSRKECAENLKKILLSIPEENYIVLKYISQFLYKVTCHNIQNEMTASMLGSIFGPLIFRMSDTDTHQNMMRNEVVTFFISDYQTIFGKEIADISQASKPLSDSSEIFASSTVMSGHKSEQKKSSVLPLMKSSLSLAPLSVVIPPIEKSLTIESLRAGSDLQIPTLIIDSEKKIYERYDQIETFNRRKNTISKGKEIGFSEENYCIKTIKEPSFKSNGESFLTDKENTTYIPAHQEIKVLTETVESQTDKQLEKLNIDDETDSLKENILENGVPVKSSLKGSVKSNIKPCRTQDRNDYSAQTNDNHAEKSFQMDNNIPSEQEDTFLPLDLSYLQEYELNDEPVLSEQRFSWPLLKPAQDDDAMLSPSVNFLRNASSSEAPLSPSAYKVYLSHRSLHLDPSIPPSPPKEQDDFCSRATKNTVSNIKVKQLKKKIHSYKKKLKQFDETFEDEHGYRPSRIEKMSYPNMKKLIINLNKARKDLKEGEKSMTETGELMGKSHWLLTRDIHILEDTTNSTAVVNDRSSEESEHKLTLDHKNKPSVEESFKEAMKNLSDERKQSHRPEEFEAMTKEEIMEEKLAIQKALLQLEDVHGRPMDKLNRDIMRPLYDRYHNIKCFIRGGNSTSSSVKDAGTELQPIIENVAMEFTSRQSSLRETDDSVTLSEQSLEENEDKASGGIRLYKKYSNSNLHELPFSELMNEQQQTRTEKRKLRRILKEFEDDFYKKTGRKVQNEDKLPMEGIYAEYKHMKGRLRLLEALVYKQKQHK